jgi:hypothetical protein
MRDSLDFSSLSNWLVHSKSSFTVNKVCGEDGVDQCRLSETCLSYTENWCQSRQTELGEWKKERTDTNDIELKASFEQFPFNLVRNRVETDIASQWSDFCLQNWGLACKRKY